MNTILGLAAYPLYLHFLGYGKYGIWLALSTVLTFAQLGNFGVSPAVSKLVAEAYGANDIQRVRRYLTTAWLAVGFSGGLIFVAVLLLRDQVLSAFNVAGLDRSTMADLLPYVALFSVYIFVVECLNATLVGLGRMDLESYFRIVSQAVALLASAVLLRAGMGVKSILVGNVISYASMHLLGVRAARSIIDSPLFSVRGGTFADLARILNLGGWVFGSSLVNMAFSPLNRIILARYGGLAVLPIYEIAFGASMRVRGLLESGCRAMMPEISRISAPVTAETIRRVAALHRKGLQLVAGLGIPLYALVVFEAAPLLDLWLRTQYDPSLPSAMRIMLVGSFFSLLSVPGYYLLLGLGRMKLTFTSILVQSLTCLAVVALYIAQTGRVSVAGVAVGVMLGMAMTSAYIVWNVIRISHLADRDENTTQPHCSRAKPGETSISRAEAISSDKPLECGLETGAV